MNYRARNRPENFRGFREMHVSTGTNNTLNQSELGANTSNWRQARKNACQKVTIGFGFSFDWLGNWRVIFNQSGPGLKTGLENEVCFSEIKAGYDEPGGSTPQSKHRKSAP